MKNRTKIVKLLLSERPLPVVTIAGWVRTRRDSRGFSFIEVNDGSCLKNMQVIVGEHLGRYEDVRKITVGSAVSVSGALVESPGGGQKWEIHAGRVDILHPAPDSYPLQKKRHSDEYLRTIAHLRPRTNKYGAALRIRSELAFAVHDFFRARGFIHVHTPIITGSDCEGAGELFRVSSLAPGREIAENGRVDFSGDFFGRETNLTVSGQLSAEMLALALGDVYTFGPTFRAEKSNTRRHAAEFWMVEPEMTFCDLEGDMDLAEEFIQHLVRHILETCADDLELFTRFVDTNLMDTLRNLLAGPFVRAPHREAVAVLQAARQPFEHPVSPDMDLQTEHERFLTEIHFRKPVIVYNYPKKIKPFYMRVNDDGQTVAAMDVLTPRIGEIIGGSQREERLDVLESRMDETGLNRESYWWYLDSRRYGSAPHSGFGLGFERMLMLVTGIGNIRDVVPFPRTPDSIEF